MNIIAERADWQQHEPELVVLVGDPYSDYIGPMPEVLSDRVATYAAGFTEGKLKREISFSSAWGDSAPFDCIYYHTSTQKGFTATENLKTFMAKALHLACDTGRKTVCLVLQGPAGEGLLDQVVEGSLVGTYAFRNYKKDTKDPFAEMNLVLALPAPVAPEPEIQPASEVLPQEKEGSEEVVESVDEEAEEKPEAESEADDSDKQDEEAEGQDAEAEELATEEKPEEEQEAEADSEQEEEAQDEPAEEEASQEEPESVEPAEIPQEVWDALKAGDDSALAVGRAFADGVNTARGLVARPAAECTPDFLAKFCKKISSKHGFSYQAFGPKQLAQHDYAGLVTVGKGADNSPRMVEMTYTPAEESEVHLVLLGKGVTFDSGGISIKGASKMHLMIGDMAGAAAVIGAMEVIGRLQPAIKVTGLVVSAENKPGAKSYRPGDIIRYKNGTSVHVENTDAEGRLILADGLIRAGELQATHIVDLATLTGAASRALGPSFTGVMGANRKLVNAITRAGGNHGESYWRLPMPLEYRDMLKSIHADINNMGGPSAGATTAALFLKEFVPPRTPWVHLDIAGTFWKEKPWKYYQEGPSGTGVKTIADLALRWAEHLG